MKLNIKLLEDGKLPKRAHEEDAAFDVYASTDADTSTPGIVSYGTGICVEVPKGYVLKFFPRSSIYKKGLLLCNSTGIIDPGYTGEIGVKFYRIATSQEPLYKKGDRIGQIILEKPSKLEFKEVKELSDSERGTGGFGSSGDK